MRVVSGNRWPALRLTAEPDGYRYHHFRHGRQQVLDDGSVRCWGYGLQGRLGYGDQTAIGDDEAPGTAGPVDLGPGRTAKAITAGDRHTCALLDDGNVRCWGYGGSGRLGYASTDNVGDNEAVGSVGLVDLGSGRTAVAISAGMDHTCALLDDGTVRCWGDGANGRLGGCDQTTVGDDETPGSVGAVDLESPRCASPPTADVSPGAPGAILQAAPATPPLVAGKAPTGAAEAARARGLRACLAAAASAAKRERSRTGSGSARERAKAMRRLRRRDAGLRRRCLRHYRRTPGHVTALQAHALSRTRVKLTFKAPGTDGSHPPPARSYVVKQSFRPIRNARDFTHARALCQRSCRFRVANVAAKITLTVTDLHAGTTYYYAVAAPRRRHGSPRPRFADERPDKLTWGLSASFLPRGSYSPPRQDGRALVSSRRRRRLLHRRRGGSRSGPPRP